MWLGILALMGALPVGCASESEKIHENFVVGATATANEPAVSLSGAASDPVLAAVKRGTVQLSAYVGSSVTSPLIDEDISVYYDKGNGEIATDEGVLNDGFKEKMAPVRAKLEAAAAVEPQLDLLRLLGGLAKVPSPSTLLVFSSGLQTTGPLDLRGMGSEINVEATVQKIDKADLPSLQGKKVVFIGLGQGEGPQPQLTERMQSSVRDLWLKVCTKADGKCEARGAVGGKPIATTPVPTIPVPGQPSVVVTGSTTKIELPSGALFEPDLASFLPEAPAMLNEIAHHFRPNATEVPVEATAVGHTATWGGRAGAITTSRERAEQVVNFLVGTGVDRALFRQVDGVGFDIPVVPDLDATGALMPAAAERNRTVVLTVTHRRRP